jgi:hypothetical protein
MTRVQVPWAVVLAQSVLRATKPRDGGGMEAAARQSIARAEEIMAINKDHAPSKGPGVEFAAFLP